jgi:hypothetical protein
MPNKALVLTMPARGSFCIIARHKGLGGGFGCVLPVRALAWPHNAGVSKLTPKMKQLGWCHFHKMCMLFWGIVGQWPRLPVRLKRLVALHNVVHGAPAAGQAQ